MVHYGALFLSQRCFSFELNVYMNSTDICLTVLVGMVYLLTMSFFCFLTVLVYKKVLL